MAEYTVHRLRDPILLSLETQLVIHREEESVIDLSGKTVTIVFPQNSGFLFSLYDFVSFLSNTEAKKFIASVSVKDSTATSSISIGGAVVYSKEASLENIVGFFISESFEDKPVVNLESFFSQDSLSIDAGLTSILSERFTLLETFGASSLVFNQSYNLTLSFNLTLDYIQAMLQGPFGSGDTPRKEFTVSDIELSFDAQLGVEISEDLVSNANVSDLFFDSNLDIALLEQDSFLKTVSANFNFILTSFSMKNIPTVLHNFGEVSGLGFQNTGLNIVVRELNLPLNFQWVVFTAP